MTFNHNNLMDPYNDQGFSHSSLSRQIIISNTSGGSQMEIPLNEYAISNQSSGMMQTYFSNNQQVNQSSEYENSLNQAPSMMGHESIIGVGVNGAGSGNSNSRKPCNCNKSNCLKLYCECFSQGQLCQNCNCTNCMNNLMYEQERSRSVKMVLDRNPNAFHPKIGRGEGERKHTKGCNCKRSGCLKNYCECYEAKISCTDLCRCQGCRNTEDSLDRRSLLRLQALELSRLKFGTSVTKHLICRVPETMSHSFITWEVIESVLHCLLGVATECDRKELSLANHEKLIMSEFNRGLVQIIEAASQSNPIPVNETTGSYPYSATNIHNDPLSGLFPGDTDENNMLYDESMRRRHIRRSFVGQYTDEDLIDSVETNPIMA